MSPDVTKSSNIFDRLSSASFSFELFFMFSINRVATASYGPISSLRLFLKSFCTLTLDNLLEFSLLVERSLLY